MLTLELLDLWLTEEVDEDDTEDHSLKELAGDGLEARFDKVNSACPFFFNGTFDGFLRAELEETGLTVFESILLLLDLTGDMPLPPLTELKEEDFEDSAGLGTTVLKGPPKPDTFDTRPTLLGTVTNTHKVNTFTRQKENHAASN